MCDHFGGAEPAGEVTRKPRIGMATWQGVSVSHRGSRALSRLEFQISEDIQDVHTECDVGAVQALST